MRRYLVLLLSVSVFFCGCTKYVQHGRAYQRVKVIRVIDKTSIEVLLKGKIFVVDLKGVYLPEEDQLEKDFFKNDAVPSRYRDYVTAQYDEARNYLSKIISAGDLLFAELTDNDGSLRKTGEIIIYASDMVSINEKMVLAGYAFPVRKAEIVNRTFADDLYRAFDSSVRRRSGLWPIGQYLIEKSRQESSGSDQVAPADVKPEKPE
jgi:endonuclease YncB( thermonuclease family)